MPTTVLSRPANLPSGRHAGDKKKRSARLRGPGVARKRPGNHFLMGRALFRTNPTASTLKDDRGQLCSSPANIEAALWASRQEAGGSAPSLP